MYLTLSESRGYKSVRYIINYHWPDTGLQGTASHTSFDTLIPFSRLIGHSKNTEILK